jgi:hypothetical protein
MDEGREYCLIYGTLRRFLKLKGNLRGAVLEFVWRQEIILKNPKYCIIKCTYCSLSWIFRTLQVRVLLCTKNQTFKPSCISWAWSFPNRTLMELPQFSRSIESAAHCHLTNNHRGQLGSTQVYYISCGSVLKLYISPYSTNSPSTVNYTAYLFPDVRMHERILNML